MSFDLSNDFGRLEHHQFQYLERLCSLLEMGEVWFADKVAWIEKKLATDAGSGSLAQELEELNLRKQEMEKMARLRSRAEKLQTDLNRFYNRHNKNWDAWLSRHSRSNYSGGWQAGYKQAGDDLQQFLIVSTQHPEMTPEQVWEQIRQNRGGGGHEGD